MHKRSKELTGPALHRYFRRFFRAQPSLSRETADSIARTFTSTVAGIRLRRAHRPLTLKSGSTSATKPTPAPPDAPSETNELPTAAPLEKFDPYAFGLVPTYQREGRDGLLSKLADVTTLDHLRRMARAQQIALPAEYRKGEAETGAVRSAIADAVEKRVADRRAAAG